MVHFVGAGPGAPDLITQRGAALLRAADVVIYAGSLVNPALLGLCRQDCSVYNSAQMTLEQVLEVVCAAADPATGQIDFILPGGQLAPRPTRPAERREEMPPRRGKDRRAMHVPKGRKGRKKR